MSPIVSESRRAILPALRACIAPGADVMQPMPDEADALGPGLDRLGVGEQVRRVRVARARVASTSARVRATAGTARHVEPSPSRPETSAASISSCSSA